MTIHPRRQRENPNTPDHCNCPTPYPKPLPASSTFHSKPTYPLLHTLHREALLQEGAYWTTSSNLTPMHSHIHNSHTNYRACYFRHRSCFPITGPRMDDAGTQEVQDTTTHKEHPGGHLPAQLCVHHVAWPDVRGLRGEQRHKSRMLSIWLLVRLGTGSFHWVSVVQGASPPWLTSWPSPTTWEPF